MSDHPDVFDAVADGLIVHNPDTDAIVDVNERFCEMMGYSRAELREMTISEITPSDWQPSKSPEQRIRTAREEGEIRFEWRNERSNGETFPVEVTLTHIEIDGEERVLASGNSNTLT